LPGNRDGHVAAIHRSEGDALLATVNGIRMFYEIAGTGSPVVFVHGLGFTSDMWHYQIPVLAREYQVVSFDTRGHGRSDKPSGPYDLQMYVDDVMALADLLRIDKAVYIGLSMGGGIVQSIALQHPDRVTALGLLSTGSDLDDRIRNRLLENADRVEAMGMTAIVDQVLSYWAPRSLDERVDDVRRVMEDEMANDPMAWAAAARANAGRDLTAQIDAIKCPVLYIGGTGDKSTPRRADTYRRLLADVEVHVLEGVGHLLPLEAPAQVNAIILDFLRRTTADYERLGSDLAF
jgi:pimeloyl-ACP methyl ester carboxylesterase